MVHRTRVLIVFDLFCSGVYNCLVCLRRTTSSDVRWTPWLLCYRVIETICNLKSSAPSHVWRSAHYLDAGYSVMGRSMQINVTNWRNCAFYYMRCSWAQQYLQKRTKYREDPQGYVIQTDAHLSKGHQSSSFSDSWKNTVGIFRIWLSIKTEYRRV